MFLKHINFTVYGESHKEHIGFVLSNVSKGIEIDFNKLDVLLGLRQKDTSYNTKRNSKIDYKIVCGIENSKTTSRPIVVEVVNNNVKSSDYDFGKIRPSHADYIGYLQDNEEFEYHGGGIFSGRMSVLYVIAGEICRQIIEKKHSISVLSHISQFGSKSDKFKTLEQLRTLKEKNLQICDEDFERYCRNELLNNRAYVSTISTYIVNAPKLMGGYFLESLESQIAAAMFSIPGVKGVDFGNLLENRNLINHELLDQFYVENKEVFCDTNFNGGINGGFSNGVQPIRFNVTYKPTSTTFNTIDTIKFTSKEYINEQLTIKGRHDLFFANRAFYAQEGLTYMIILDNLLFNGEI